MKIRCAYRRELFVPSSSQLKELSPHGSHYCSRKCRNPEQPTLGDYLHDPSAFEEAAE